MKVRLATFTLLLATTALLGFTGCGSESDEENGSSGNQSTKESGEAGGSKVNTVDFAFEPKDLKIKSGETVTWKNTGDTTHTVKGPGVFSKAIDPGDSFSHRFTQKGSFSFKYICTLHPQDMKGKIVVTS